MLKHEFAYKRPTGLEEVLALKKADKSAVYIAGGTDLIPLVKCGLIFPQMLISLEKIPGLNEMAIVGDSLEIGAMMPLRKLAKLARASDTLTRLPGLTQAAGLVASPQIQSIGTLGGNLLQSARCFYFNQTGTWRKGIEACLKTGGNVCHQAPAQKICPAPYYSDLAPVLLAAGASVRVYGEEGVVVIPLIELTKNMSLLGNGIITHLILPDIANLKTLLFRKRAVRVSIDFPLANAALALHGDGRTQIVIGAMARVPFFLEKTQAELEACLKNGRAFSPTEYKMALDEARTLMRPIREATVSPAVKQKAMNAVLFEVIKDLERRLANREIIAY